MAAGYQVSRGGNGPSGDTNVSAIMPTSSTTVTFANPSSLITIVNNSTASIPMYINFNGTATTSNFQISGGGSYTYDGPPRNYINIIAPTATTDTYSIFAY